ncbi:hypothetical protein FMN63_26175 [Stappia sp. BW2]|nr:hypothetical protein FMN63_26175 [Stappia sp. BW2]
MPKSSRHSPLQDTEREALLVQLALARQALIKAQRGMRPRSGLSRSAAAVIEEIDEFAFVLTGSSDFFHTGTHGTPPR